MVEADNSVPGGGAAGGGACTAHGHQHPWPSSLDPQQQSPMTARTAGGPQTQPTTLPSAETTDQEETWRCFIWTTHATLSAYKALKAKVAQSWPTLCDPMDYNLPGSSVHGILQVRILGWVAWELSNLSPSLWQKSLSLMTIKDHCTVFD